MCRNSWVGQLSRVFLNEHRRVLYSASRSASDWPNYRGIFAQSEDVVTMSTPSSITPQDFVDSWRSATLKEHSAHQEHFIDLCRLIGHPTPAEVDPTGENFAFEYGAARTPCQMSS